MYEWKINKMTGFALCMLKGDVSSSYKMQTKILTSNKPEHVKASF